MENLTPKKTPWSSVVGGGITLIDKNGRPKFMIMICGTTDGVNKEQDYDMICDLDRKAAAWDNLLADIKAGEWQIVPVESTEIMIESGQMDLSSWSSLPENGAAARDCYKEMLKDAPKYPGVPE